MGVLIAAHGLRGAGAKNDGFFHLAERVASHFPTSQVGVGFIKGEPGIDAAIRKLDAANIVVYPLFLGAGYFGRTVVGRAVEEMCKERPDCVVKVLPPLGLDPELADIIGRKAAHAARSHSFAARQTTLVLLAHGSRQDPASADAAEKIAQRIRATGLFSDICVAFLEQTPTFNETLTELAGPVIVVGLFTGDGLHGADDVNRLMSGLNRRNAICLQNVGQFAELEDLVTARIDRALTDLVAASF
ncbi:MAG: sirohydrochlorin chelatase [Pseudolabrys sp.]